MKKILILFFVSLVFLTLNCQAETGQEPGIFNKLSIYITGGVFATIVGIIAAILKKKGLMPKIDFIAKMTAKWSRKAAIILNDTADVAEKVDQAIDDTSGDFDKSKIDEIKEEIKDVIEDVKDLKE